MPTTPPPVLYAADGTRWVFSGLAADGRATYAPAQAQLIETMAPPQMTGEPMVWNFQNFEGE